MLKHRYIVPVFIGVVLGFLVSHLLLKTSLQGLWLVGIIFLGLVSWGAFDIRLGYFLPVYFRHQSEKNRRVALTFDDGPTIHTQAVLDLLDQYKAKATFFCIGKQIEKQPELLRKIYEKQHIIGNHTYTHASNTGFLSTEKMLEEIRLNDELIAEIIHVKPRLFRPPFGVTNPHIAQAVKKTGHKVIGWSIRSLDTLIDDEDKIINKVTSKLKPGSVILFHDSSEKTIRIVEQLLLFLEEKEYQCVTLEDLFGIKAYGDSNNRFFDTGKSTTQQ
ncbi:polysaccharide deacetylase family protein [Flavobacterium sp. NKUCC04_CG]|uniref:polysaccharide deacetylase family protein n=1 Tax=Flavobacterium sp. NKUCC04_CG TaxID=2842121 RepID=UPI001C5AE70E|nr:polysaccharide deacetylase family protein [Flavobacterium sp. NKUCC04_CG]MBW3518404.1 polysaccharide deacetylase family protein [Flavobacterium sp. NKUCC04_CG]